MYLLLTDPRPDDGSSISKSRGKLGPRALPPKVFRWRARDFPSTRDHSQFAPVPMSRCQFAGRTWSSFEAPDVENSRSNANVAGSAAVSARAAIVAHSRRRRLGVCGARRLGPGKCRVRKKALARTRGSVPDLGDASDYKDEAARTAATTKTKPLAPPSPPFRRQNVRSRASSTRRPTT